MKVQVANQPHKVPLGIHCFDFVPWIDIEMEGFKLSIIQSTEGELFISQRVGEGFQDIKRQLRITQEEIKLYDDTGTLQDHKI